MINKLKTLGGFFLLASSLTFSPSAYALNFTSANSAGGNISGGNTLSYGQGFNPSVQGNAGTGTRPVSGSVFLTSFSFGAVSSASGIAVGNLYVFSAPYTNTPTNLAVTSTNLIGSSNGTSSNFYTFAGNGLTLDVNTDYYAYQDAANIFVGFGGTYGNASSQIGFQANNSSSSFSPVPAADLNFTANFTTSVPVPFEFSPTLGIGILGGAWLVRRKLRKKSAITSKK
jgi:hypothetical protein